MYSLIKCYKDYLRGKMNKRVSLDTFLLFYIISVGAILFLIFNNEIILAGRTLTILLAISFLFSFFRENPVGNFTMTIFVFAPFLSFLRQYMISYNGISILLFIALLLWLLRERGIVFKNTIFDRRILGICVFIAGFVIYGLLPGTPLARFMKFVETVSAILLFTMALNDIPFVKKYLIYFIFSSILIVISLLQH